MTKEHYTAFATSKSPALIMFLVDISGSMAKSLPGGKLRIEAANEAINTAVNELYSRSAKGRIVRPRYHISFFGYSGDFYNIPGKKLWYPIDEFGNIEMPILKPQGKTNMEKAFLTVKDILLSYKEASQTQPEVWPYPNFFPAPLIIHITDIELKEKYGDPEPIVNEIKNIEFPDGNVLIENIFITDLVKTGTIDYRVFKGFTDGHSTGVPLADKFLRMSSTIPDNYLEALKIDENKQSNQLQIQKGAKMFFPGDDPDFIASALVISKASGDLEKISSNSPWSSKSFTASEIEDLINSDD